MQQALRASRSASKCSWKEAHEATRFAASGLPDGLRIDELTGEISGTPTNAGRFRVTLTTSDGNATASGTLDLAFSEDPAFPNIISPDNVTITSGQDLVYKIEAPVPPSEVTDPTTFQVIGDLPVGLTFDPKTGTISGTVRRERSARWRRGRN